MSALRPLLAAFAAVVSMTVPSAVPAQAAAETGGTPRLDHVFVIVLENEGAAQTFSADGPRYLATRLPSMGAFVPGYHAVGHLSLGNYLAMISGQAPNPATQADCPFFSDFLPGTPAAGGQVTGSGCVYPASVPTIADQLEAKGLRWRGYMEDMAAGAPGEPTACRHPAIGAVDGSQRAEPGDQYATRHDPFVYFHSIIDDGASCERHVVDYSQLRADLKRPATTPAYSFISPNLCHDGHDEPCVDGAPGGLVSAGRFLSRAVPAILHSPAFDRRSLLVVTFDEAEAAGSEADSSACCGQLPGPNTANPGFLYPGPGGGRTGAVLVSPCIEPGTLTRRAYNHYSLLRSIEDGFGLDHLGYAAQPGLRPFGRDVFTGRGCTRKPRDAAPGR